jgi:UPF0716 protein FxsA
MNGVTVAVRSTLLRSSATTTNGPTDSRERTYFLLMDPASSRGDRAFSVSSSRWVSGALVRYFLLVLGLLIGGAYLELTVLLMVAEHWGWSFALAGTILTGIGGIAIARSLGWYVIWNMRQDLDAGRVPVASMFDGLLLLVAGVLLLLPGLISDGLGLLLLIPWVRQGVRWVIVRYWMRRSGSWKVYHRTPWGSGRIDRDPVNSDPNVIEGEIVPPLGPDSDADGRERDG